MLVNKRLKKPNESQNHTSNEITIHIDSDYITPQEKLLQYQEKPTGFLRSICKNTFVFIRNLFCILVMWTIIAHTYDWIYILKYNPHLEIDENVCKIFEMI